MDNARALACYAQRRQSPSLWTFTRSFVTRRRHADARLQWTRARERPLEATNCVRRRRRRHCRRRHRCRRRPRCSSRTPRALAAAAVARLPARAPDALSISTLAWLGFAPHARARAHGTPTRQLSVGEQADHHHRPTGKRERRSRTPLARARAHRRHHHASIRPNTMTILAAARRVGRYRQAHRHPPSPLAQRSLPRDDLSVVVARRALCRSGQIALARPRAARRVAARVVCTIVINESPLDCSDVASRPQRASQRRQRQRRRRRRRRVARCR